ncbi:unnamed protein product [Nesidiocoris tenuis]|uniref:Uncharacterized protein n=1 Tax=Nesidiocoris tenuis TaxID=355587 RepID=A0A6H5HIM6_9HEMI|nr:unnamed protein product [Nesidiocoris tenuis]
MVYVEENVGSGNNYTCFTTLCLVHSFYYTLVHFGFYCNSSAAPRHSQGHFDIKLIAVNLRHCVPRAGTQQHRFLIMSSKVHVSKGVESGSKINPPSAIQSLPSAAQRLPSAVHRPPSTVRRPPPAVRCPPSAINRLPSTACRPLSTVHRLPSAVHRPPPAVRCPPSAINRLPSAGHRPPPAVRCPPSTIHRPPFKVCRPQSTVCHPLSTGLPLPAITGTIEEFVLNYLLNNISPVFNRK